MKPLIAILIAGILLITTSVSAEGFDYTGRKYLSNACELFAADAYQASDNLLHGVDLRELLELIESAPVSDSEKDRALQAIQLVWNNRMDNPVLAYTVAMGLCLKPRENMAPMDEPWIISPRTISGHF